MAEGTWGSITGTLSAQTDLQAALDAKQNLLTTTPLRFKPALAAADAATGRTLLGAQASNLHLDDLADGSLTGSKVGTGINAANITVGTLALARGGLGRGRLRLYQRSLRTGGWRQPLTSIPRQNSVSALGITGTPSAATVLRGDFTWGTSPGAITVREEDASPSASQCHRDPGNQWRADRQWRGISQSQPFRWRWRRRHHFHGFNLGR